MSDLSVFADPFSTAWERAYPPSKIMLAGEVHEVRLRPLVDPGDRERHETFMRQMDAEAAALGRLSRELGERIKARGLAKRAARNG